MEQLEELECKLQDKSLEVLQAVNSNQPFKLWTNKTQYKVQKGKE